MIRAIEDAGGLAFEYRCYGLVPTGEFLDLEGADVVLFTSANSFSQARLPDLAGIIPAAIGEITAKRMKEGGVTPIVVGDGSLEGTLIKLNEYLKTP